MKMNSLAIQVPGLIKLIIYFCCLSCFLLVQGEKDYFKEFLHQAIRTKRETAEPGNANQYFDELLNNTKELIVDRGYDPLSIGQIDICENCILNGLTSIKRTGDVTLLQKDDDVILHTNVGFDELLGTCYCSKKVLFIKFNGKLTANLRDLAMQGTIRISTTYRIRPVLEEFSVTNNGNLDLKWEGRGFLGFLSETFFNLFKGKFRRHAQEALPGLLRTAIANNLDKLSSLSGS